MSETDENLALLIGSSGAWDRAKGTYHMTGNVGDELRLIIEEEAEKNNVDFETYLEILKKIADDPYDEAKWQEGRKPPRDWGAIIKRAQGVLELIAVIGVLAVTVIIGSAIGYHVGFSMVGPHLSQMDSALTLGIVGGMCGIMIDIVGLLILDGVVDT